MPQALESGLIPTNSILVGLEQCFSDLGVPKKYPRPYLKELEARRLKFGTYTNTK